MISLQSLCGAIRNSLAKQHRARLAEMDEAERLSLRKRARETSLEEQRLQEIARQIMRQQARQVQSNG
ncbi:hypothetical protein [Aquibium oceanicum]|uniref:Uncharacterized protein n=1 Tax=Aquibium oceanicum TaxID=1670800 RepID=A0A1L3SXE4_9HYPH|nr:hypothetical protein [Aquibium oceanicum]APH74089.1 hypothetical protein BSQ44_24015 [Aquibium oceanicum]